MATAFGFLTGSRPGGRGATLEAPTYHTVRRGIARELNRARRFERPLSVLVLRTDSLKTTGVEAAVRIALQRLRDTDLWFHRPEDGELVLVAPETGHEAVRFVGQRLATSLSTGDGIPVEWSTATFPVDGLTFEVLYQACQERISVPARGRVIESAGRRS